MLVVVRGEQQANVAGAAARPRGQRQVGVLTLTGCCCACVELSDRMPGTSEEAVQLLTKDGGSGEVLGWMCRLAGMLTGQDLVMDESGAEWETSVKPLFLMCRPGRRVVALLRVGSRTEASTQAQGNILHPLGRLLEPGWRWRALRRVAGGGRRSERGGVGGGRREFQEAGQVLLLRGQDRRNGEEWVWKGMLVV